MQNQLKTYCQTFFGTHTEPNGTELVFFVAANNPNRTHTFGKTRKEPNPAVRVFPSLKK